MRNRESTDPPKRAGPLAPPPARGSAGGLALSASRGNRSRRRVARLRGKISRTHGGKVSHTEGWTRPPAESRNGLAILGDPLYRPGAAASESPD